MALCTQADLEMILQIDFLGDPDDTVTFLIASAQALIEKFCGRTFEEESGLTVTLDGRGVTTLFLRKTPVTAVNQVTEDGTVLAADDFMFYSDGRLIRRSGDADIRWTWKRQAVTVDYDGGYATVPDDLAYLCANIAARMFQRGAAFANTEVQATVTSQKLGDFSESYDLNRAAALEITLTDDEKRALSAYRRRW